MAQAIAVIMDWNTHRDLLVRAAGRGMSPEEYVHRLIQRDLHPERCPQMTPKDAERILGILAELEKNVDQLADCVRPPEESQGGMVPHG